MESYPDRYHCRKTEFSDYLQSMPALTKTGRLFFFVWWLLVMLLPAFSLSAQEANPYHLNGSASQNSCNCYTLTPDQLQMSGSVWNKTKIDLNQPFDFKFEVYLGCQDAPGADGIAFLLQPLSTEVGTTGEGLGFQGIEPSIAVAIDTWQNPIHDDPYYDNIAIHQDGNIENANTPKLLSGPVSVTFDGDIEDCEWHTLRIIWDPVAQHIQAEVDGELRVQAHKDLIGEVFHGDPMVFWGFTGATGGSTNLQKVCTSLNASFYLPDGQITCFPEPIQFIDSSRSFGSIVEWRWDFGDGTTSDLQNPPPHLYPAPGNYDVKLNILGNNGCLSDTFTKRIVAGTKPVAAFEAEPLLVCDGVPTLLQDHSTVEFGTINTWTWEIGAQQSEVQNPNIQLPVGPTPVTLTVETQEGCISQPVSRTLFGYPSPTASFQFAEVCLSEPSTFIPSNESHSIPVKQWNWNFNDGSTNAQVTTSARQQIVERKFPDKGLYDVSVYAVGENGCPSAVVTKQVKIDGTRAYAGNDTLVAENQPLQLTGSGGEIYKWSPATGLSSDNIANPVAILQRDQTYLLSASIPSGCFTYDTINVKVYKGPTIYVPSAFSPNHDGNNDMFRFLAVGMTSLDFFQVFNRYGQMVYSSKELRAGWDGTVNGNPQPSGTYVWTIKGRDYLGNIISKKGTVVLIR